MSILGTSLHLLGLIAPGVSDGVEFVVELSQVLGHLEVVELVERNKILDVGSVIKQAQSIPREVCRNRNRKKKGRKKRR